METAEKLARFVAQVGPEIEQFSIENSTDNPDLWYVAVVPFEFECVYPTSVLRGQGMAQQTHFCPRRHPRSHGFTSAKLRAVREERPLRGLGGATLIWGIRKNLPWREV